MIWTQDQSWLPIDSAPRDGSRVELLIPYSRELFSEAECTDEGSWDAEAEWPYPPNSRENPLRGCWRFDGDDGAFDIQPEYWRPLRQR